MLVSYKLMANQPSCAYSPRIAPQTFDATSFVSHVAHEVSDPALDAAVLYAD